MYLESNICSKFLSIFLAGLLVCLPVIVKAESTPQTEPKPLLTDLNGTVTSLNKGESAPYAGILLDSEATAKILTERKYLGLQYELKLDLEIIKRRDERSFLLFNSGKPFGHKRIIFMQN